jgi:predicted MFS family arabinose efflux permease
MLGFPYSNAFAMKRAQKGSEGRYMALYSMAFAAAHVVSPKIGMDVVARYGYFFNFMVITCLSSLSIILAIRLHLMVNKEQKKLT